MAFERVTVNRPSRPVSAVSETFGFPYPACLDCWQQGSRAADEIIPAVK